MLPSKEMCTCNKCGISIPALPEYTCPYCATGKLEAKWWNPLYVEDVKQNGEKRISVIYSVGIVPDKHCTIHKERE